MIPGSVRGQPRHDRSKAGLKHGIKEYKLLEYGACNSWEGPLGTQRMTELGTSQNGDSGEMAPGTYRYIMAYSGLPRSGQALRGVTFSYLVNLGQRQD